MHKFDLYFNSIVVGVDNSDAVVYIRGTKEAQPATVSVQAPTLVTERFERVVIQALILLCDYNVIENVLLKGHTMDDLKKLELPATDAQNIEFIERPDGVLML
jgi:hypothetical protein